MMLKMASNIKAKNKEPKIVNTLKVLLRSLKYRLAELNEINEKINSKSKNRGLDIGEK